MTNDCDFLTIWHQSSATFTCKLMWVKTNPLGPNRPPTPGILPKIHNL